MTTKRQDTVPAINEERELVEEQEPSQERTPLLEILDRALDKGVHIGGWVHVPVFGIEVLELDFDVLIVSCAKYMEYAGAMEQASDVEEMAYIEHEQLPPQPQG